MSAEERTRERARIGLLLNPACGASQRFVEVLLGQAKLHVELFLSSDPDEARNWVRHAAGRVDRIVLGGGDGTVSQAIAGLAPEFPDVEIAVLPLGTGNDLARAVGVEQRDLEAAARTALQGTARKVDAVRCRLDGEERVFLNVANGGFGGQISSRMSIQSKDRMGSLAYWLSGAAASTSPQSYEVDVELDGEKSRRSLIGIAVANGRFVGGGFEIAPGADLSDGLLDVTFIPDLGSLELLAEGMRYVLGGDPDETPAEAARARDVSLVSEPAMPMSIDGELTQFHEATFEVLPGVLRMATAPST